MVVLRLQKLSNRVGGVMVSVLPTSTVDRGFEHRSGQIKYYNIGIYPAMTAFIDQYSLHNICFDIGQL